MLDMINTRIIGLGEYRLSADEPGVLMARYITSASRAIGSGRARGDTSDGFAGHYRIQYFDAAGELTGDLDLNIQQTGESYRLTWRHRRENVRLPVAVGDVVYEGIGLLTDDNTMAITYWMSEKLAAAEARPLL
ncbi:MAG: hypothetical protein QOD58_4599 [Mycobacterium sp.]|jgi:hypothetical protein|nr:hypothetical protein [Mycobacterium sp.]